MKTKLQKLIKLPYLFLGLCLLLPGISTFNSLAAEKSVRAIDLAIRNKTLIEIFETIESQTAYNFIYDTKITQDAAKYNINISQKDIQSVLKQLENLSPYTFRLYQHSISVKYQEEQQLILKGNVRDSQNIPLPGASVLMKSSGVGTTTDFDGNFSLEVSNFPVEIQISYMGFETQLIKLETNRVLEVTLQESDNALSEVVITALGIKREEKKLGYAQQSISNESLTAARPNNWSEALRGKVPGLNINGLSGPVGSQQIVLRGNASLDPSNNAALIVIDGVPIQNEFPGSGASNGYMGGSASNDTPVDFGNAIADLNPEDIASVSVLKGPAAAALYGYQGANGAVIITTKSGKKAKGLGVTFSSNTKIDIIQRWPDWQYTYGQGSGKGSYLKPATDENGNPVAYNDRLYYSYGASEDGNSTGGSSSAFGPKFDGQYYFQYDPELEGQSAERQLWRPYKDNRKDFWRTGVTHTQNVAVQGGGDAGNMRASLTHTKNEWIMPNTGFEQLSLSLNASHRISEKIKMQGVANYRNKTSDNLPGQGYNNHSIAYFMIFQNPNVNLDWYKPIWKKDADQLDMIRPYSSYIDNPYAMAHEIINALDQHAFTGNLNTQIKLSPSLELMLRGSINMYNKNMRQERPYDINRYARGYYRKTNVFKNETNLDFLLTYTKQFKNWNLTGNLGGNRLDYQYLRQDSWAEGLEIPGQYNLVNGTETFTSEYDGFNKVNSLYGLLNIDYRGYLFIDITARNDWNSMLPKKNQSYFFPSINSGFVFSEIIDLGQSVSFAKLRGSWAQVGGAGQFANRYKTQKYYGRSDFPGAAVAPGSLYNTNLKPEITTSTEFGLDWRMFKSRLKLDLSVYENISKNQILSTPLPQSSGYSNMLINAGKVRNRGVEVLLSATALKSQNFSWNTTLTWSKNEGKVLSLHENAENGQLEMLSSSGAKLMAVEGGSPTALFGRAYLRNEEGQVIYDNKGAPKMTDNSVYIGDTQPKWIAGFINKFTYKNFDLNLVIDGKYGGKIYSHTHHKLTQQGKLKHTLKGRDTGELIGKGVVENPDGSYSENTTPLSIANYYNLHYPLANTEANSFDGSFVKLREISLGYSFGRQFLAKSFLTDLKLSIYGRNLAVISDFPIYDPEVAGIAGGSSMHPGVEVGQMPVPAEYGFNLKVSF